MKKRFGRFSAGVLSAALVLGSSFPIFAADASETELAADLGQAQESLEDAKNAVTDAIGSASGKAYTGSVRIEPGEMLLQALQESDGEDPAAWINSLSGTGSWKKGEDGNIGFSGEFLMNDSHIMNANVSYEPDSGKLYIQMPELKETPMVVDVGQFLQSSAEFNITDAAGNELDPAMVQKLGEDFAGLLDSISDEDISDFAGRYAGLVTSSVETGTNADVTVSAGSLSRQATETVFTISQENMKALLQNGSAGLKDDPLVLKVLGSDFAADILQLAQASEQQAGDSFALTPDSLVQVYQSFMDQISQSVSDSVPGVSLLFGTDDEGNMVSFGAHVIYQGVDLPLFTFETLREGDKNATEFTLGEMIASAFLGSQDGSSTSAGPTGFVLEGSTEGGKLNETLTVQAAGTDVGSLAISDWDLHPDGCFLTGKLTLSAAGETAALELSHPDETSERIAVTLDGQSVATATFSGQETDSADITAFDTEGAFAVSSDDDLETYLKDADPSVVAENLKKAGAPAEMFGESETEDTAA